MSMQDSHLCANICCRGPITVIIYLYLHDDSDLAGRHLGQLRVQLHSIQEEHVKNLISQVSRALHAQPVLPSLSEENLTFLENCMKNSHRNISIEGKSLNMIIKRVERSCSSQMLFTITRNLRRFNFLFQFILFPEVRNDDE